MGRLSFRLALILLVGSRVSLGVFQCRMFSRDMNSLAEQCWVRSPALSRTGTTILWHPSNAGFKREKLNILPWCGPVLLAKVAGVGRDAERPVGAMERSVCREGTAGAGCAQSTICWPLGKWLRSGGEAAVAVQGSEGSPRGRFAALPGPGCRAGLCSPQRHRHRAAPAPGSGTAPQPCSSGQVQTVNLCSLQRKPERCCS